LIGPLTWLSKSRLCIKSAIAKRSGHPLSAYTPANAFKIFYLDVGLLNAALDSPMEAIVQNKLESYKGFMVENFVAEELFSQLGHDLVSWQEGESEIEFLVASGENIIPMEVKSGAKSRRAKSLAAYIQKYHPPFAYKVTSQNVGQNLGKSGANEKGGFLTLPLYLCSKIVKNHC
jgi:predicted AAA+ superfamily ATPase